MYAWVHSRAPSVRSFYPGLRGSLGRAEGSPGSLGFTWVRSGAPSGRRVH